MKLSSISIVVDSFSKGLKNSTLSNGILSRMVLPSNFAVIFFLSLCTEFFSHAYSITASYIDPN